MGRSRKWDNSPLVWKLFWCRQAASPIAEQEIQAAAPALPSLSARFHLPPCTRFCCCSLLGQPNLCHAGGMWTCRAYWCAGLLA